MKEPKIEINYTDDLPEWVGGRCTYPWFPKFGTCKIEIRKKYIKDEGLLNHEICHARQYANGWLHSIRYMYDKAYRYECELEAYTEQIEAYNYTSASQYSWIVDALYNKYDLGISKDVIMKDVRKLVTSEKKRRV